MANAPASGTREANVARSGEALDRIAIARSCQHVRRQRGEPAGDVVTECLRSAGVEIETCMREVQPQHP